MIHYKQGDLYPGKPSKISAGTAVTPGTPVSEDFIKVYQKRAAIMDSTPGYHGEMQKQRLFEECFVLYEEEQQ